MAEYLTGAERIAAERDRQITVEGFRAAEDDGYVNHELSRAAASYLLSSRASQVIEPGETLPIRPPSSWPWPDAWWKPDYGVGDLIKAGALIAAEIDRLERRDRA